MRVQVYILFFWSMLLLTGGCAATRTVKISTIPTDAEITVDGQYRGRGPITPTFTFDDPRQLKKVVARKQGYKDEMLVISKDGTSKEEVMRLKVQSRVITVMVEPLTAIIKVDGQPLNNGLPTTMITQYELQFPIDAKGYRAQHVITAERPGFRQASEVVTFIDSTETYTLKLDPMTKDIAIMTNPPGAMVYLEGESIGKSGPQPARALGRAFSYDDQARAYVSKTVKLTMPGYDPVEEEVNWDDGKTDYLFDLKPKGKEVRVRPDQAAVTLKIENRDVRAEPDGSFRVPLTFQPVNDTGELKVYEATASKSPEGEWQPLKFKIGWENGKTDYPIKLKQIMTRRMPLLTTSWTFANRAWTVEPKWIDTTARIDTAEADSAPVKLTNLPAGSCIDSLAISPDGKTVVFTVLSSSNKSDLRSQMFTVPTDGSAVTSTLSDGKSLDLTPTYTPAGDQIVFSSNQAGNRLSICAMSTSGSPTVTRLTAGESNDLFPVVDSDPKPKLYYESRGVRQEPRLCSNPVGQTLNSDLTRDGGMQPRVSPRNDQVIFTLPDPKTGKRDLFTVSATGGYPKNLTNSPEIDEYDPTWNSDGGKIAYASDDGLDPDHNRNVNIKVMDLRKSAAVDTITTNGSQDDCPAWDPSGRTIYFRSNRGGEWAIWKIDVK